MDGRMIPAGICIPNVIDARMVPITAENMRRMMVGTVENLPQRPRRVEPSLQSLNNAATSSVDCTLTSKPLYFKRTNDP